MSKLKEMRNANSKSKGLNPKLLVLPMAGLLLLAGIIAFVSQPNSLTVLPKEGTQQKQGEDNSTPVIGEIKTFTDTGKEIELENGKPVIRLFSTTWCPHCRWIKQTFDKVAKEYMASGKIVAYHWELDTGDNTLTDAVESNVPETELAVFREFNPRGSVPTFVFGGKYYRIGNGYEMQKDLASEEAEFRGVIETLIKEVQSKQNNG